jgi:hypothetical protein
MYSCGNRCYFSAWWEVLHELCHGAGRSGICIPKYGQVARLDQYISKELHVDASPVPCQLYLISIFAGIDDLGFIAYITLILNLISIVTGQRAVRQT